MTHAEQEPEDRAWVYAATGFCPERLAWQRRGEFWVDAHGCKRKWEGLVDPIDTLEPEGQHPHWEPR